MRTMYDSVTPGRIPRDAEMVAGYGNGEWRWTTADFARFPHAGHVSVDVLGTDPQNCGVLDVERGAATPATARIWASKRIKLGHKATIYCSRDSLGVVREACKGLHVFFWVADWTGKPHHVAGCVATQYKNDQAAGYDISAVYDDTWHPSPK